MKKTVSIVIATSIALGMSACSSDNKTTHEASSSPSSSIDAKSVSVAPNAKPVNLPDSLNVGARGSALDALISGKLTAKSLPVARDVGQAPKGKRQVSIPGIGATGTWEPSGFVGLDVAEPKSATFSLPKTMWGLRSTSGAVILGSSLIKNKLAATSFNAFASIKLGQVVWVTDGIGTPWQYRIVSAQTMKPSDANALATRPAGNKRLEIVLPAGTYDTKVKTYTKRVVITAMSTSKTLTPKAATSSKK